MQYRKIVWIGLWIAIAIYSINIYSLGADDGSIVIWGSRVAGVDLSQGFVDIAGFNVSLGLKEDGSIVAWGNNVYHQCDIPVPNESFTSIAANVNHCLGLKDDGSIVGWGLCFWGEDIVPNPNEDFIAISAGREYSMGLKSNGSIVAWGYNRYGQCNVSAPNEDFIAIAAGGNHSLGLKSDGSIVAWGWNGDGQCNVPSPNKDFIAIAASNYYSVGLKSDGSIVAWGTNDQGQCNVPAPNENFIAISACKYHCLGLKTDGSIVAWGWNDDGQCDVPVPNEEYVGIVAGEGHSLGLKADGSIVAWGSNRYSQCNVPAPNKGFMDISSGCKALDLNLGLKADSSIVAWGYNSTAGGQCNVPPPNKDFVAVAAGYVHGLGLKAYGYITAWGDNFYDQCNVPFPNENFVAIAVGEYHSLGLKENGSIVAWGNNDQGQCNIPAPNENFVDIIAHMNHSLGLKTNGSIVAWGRNDEGQCNVPAPNEDFVAIAVGIFHSMGLKENGTIVAWGENRFGQCNVPAPNVDFVDIAAGSLFSMGLKTDGSIVVWGDNRCKQRNIPIPNENFMAVDGGESSCLAIRGEANPMIFKVKQVAPSHAGNTGMAVIKIIGSGFKEGIAVRLSGATQLDPNEMIFLNPFRLQVLFDLQNVVPGYYDVVVTNPNGQEVVLPDGFEVSQGGEPKLWSQLSVPSRVRPLRNYTGYIYYGNDGDVEMPMPIFNLTNSGSASMQIGSEGRMSDTALTFLGISQEGLVSTLLPGEQGCLPFRFVPTSSTEWIEFGLTVFEPNDLPFDWDALEAVVRPCYRDDEQWTLEWEQLKSQMGTTWREVIDDVAYFLDGITNPDTLDSDLVSAVTLAMWLKSVEEMEAITAAEFLLEGDVYIEPQDMDNYDSNKTCTYILTHGWKPVLSKFQELRDKILQHCPQCNVLRINWEAKARTFWPRGAADNIASVAEQIHRQLDDLGIDWNQATYIGHSFGNSVNHLIASKEGYKGKAIILDPANYYGGPNPDFSGKYTKGSLAIITDSFGDNGPCHPFPRRIADRQLHLESDILWDGHGKALQCLVNHIENSECDSPLLQGILAQTLPEMSPGWYDGEINDVGEVVGEAFFTCSYKDYLLYLLPNPLFKIINLIHMLRSVDPNIKNGPEGYDPNDTPPEQIKRFVRTDEPLQYTIYFENDPNATAPAQEVIITDYLHPCLDLSTFTLGEVVFGDMVVHSLAGLIGGTETVPLDDPNFVIDIEAEIDIQRRRVRWSLRMIDVITGELPEDPLAGFLPPNDPNTHCGEGHVTFTIYPYSDFENAHITNKASIIFDTEEPLQTNIWVNTTDGAPPASEVLTLPQCTLSPNFEVKWSGDDGQGSGNMKYSIYVSIDGEPNVPWIVDTTETSSIFYGQLGRTYAFYSIARDALENIEGPPLIVDATTTLGPVNLKHYSLLSNLWMKSECIPPLWCNGYDFNQDGIVDLIDLATFTQYWLEGTIIPPSIPGDIVPPYGVDSNDLAVLCYQWLSSGTFCADIAPPGGDGKVNMLDFSIMAQYWLEGTE